jgi:methionyl-tRNA formyltransferase
VLGDKRERIRVLRAAAVDLSGIPGTVLDGHLTVACGQGAIRLLVVQRAGKKAVGAQEFLRGFPLQPGVLLTGDH